MEVQQHDDGNQEAEGEGSVSARFMRFVKCVRSRELLLVVFEALLLLRVKDGIFFGSSFIVGAIVTKLIYGTHLNIDALVCVVYPFQWKVVFVLEFGKCFFPTQTPGHVGVAHNKNHVVSVYCTEWGESVSYYGE